MSPQIRVDDDVYELLKQKAEAFVDTPNTVLRRVLGLAKGIETEAGGDEIRGVKKTTSARNRFGTRAKTGDLLPIEVYYEPILASLVRQGGTAKVAGVLDEVGELLKGQLTPVDRSELATGGIRWKNRAQWARKHLVGQGLIGARSPKGYWTITDKGRQRVVGKSR